MTQHIASPDHHPGSLYGCNACESICYCDEYDDEMTCLSCELEAEQEDAYEEESSGIGWD